MRILANRKHKLMHNIAVRHSRFPRGSAGAHISNHTTTIIIAVVVSVGGFVLVVVFWSLYSRYSRHRSAAPLPPVQPLAHQREHQLASFAHHKATANRDTCYSASPSSHRSLLPVASDVSLLPHPSDPGKIPSRQGSFNTYETGEELSSASLLEPLSPPIPGFHDSNVNCSPSTSSVSSGGQSNSSPATPFTPPSQSSSSSLISPQPHDASAPNKKRLSVLSSSTGRSSRIRANTFRGAPHSLHNNIQIVLPTPLAPEVYPQMIGAEDSQGRSITIGGDGAGSRMSLALTDKWVPVGNMVTRPPPVPSRRLASQSRGRPVDGPPQNNRRSMSNPAPASRLRQSTVPAHERFAASGRTSSMPLPRIPSAPHLADKRRAATDSLPVVSPSTPPSSFPIVSMQHRQDWDGMPQQARSRGSMESRSSRRLSLS